MYFFISILFKSHPHLVSLPTMYLYTLPTTKYYVQQSFAQSGQLNIPWLKSNSLSMDGN